MSFIWEKMRFLSLRILKYASKKINLASEEWICKGKMPLVGKSVRKLFEVRGW